MKTFLEIPEYYNNVFNPVNGYMCPRLSNGNFIKNFDALDTHRQGFIEGAGQMSA